MNQIDLKYKFGRFMIMLDKNLRQEVSLSMNESIKGFYWRNFERIYKHEGLMKDSK